jgi:hypothetical protein
VRWPKPAFDIRAVQRFDPPLPPLAALAASALFVLLLAATALLLWHAHQVPGALLWGGAAAIVAGLWAVGTLCTPRAAASLGNP